METFPRYWPFVRGIHRSPVNYLHKGQWRGALMFSLICIWINGWVNNGEAGDLRRSRAHYDVIVMDILHQYKRQKTILTHRYVTIDCRLRHNASTHPYHCDASTWNAISNLLDIYSIPLRWRHNDHTGVSNHQPHGCLLNRLFRLRSKKTSKLRVTGLCAGNSPGPVNSPHKGPVTRKIFPFDDVIMHGHIHGRSWKYLGHWYYSPPNWCQISWITQILHGHRFFIRAKAWLGRAKCEFHK